MGLPELAGGSGDDRRLTRPLLTRSGMIVGLFECPADHPLWRRPNNIGPATLIAFPGTPVEIARAGIGAICADRNQVVVYSPGQEYRRSRLHPRGDVCSYVALSEEVLDGALAGRGARALLRAGRCVVPAASWLRYQVALAQLRAGRLAAVGFEEQVLSVVADVLDATGSAAGLSAVARRMEAVRERLSVDLEQQLTVEDVASELDVSPFHLVRQFKEHTGWTMHAYRTQLRLRAATEIALGETRRTLSDVAAMTGFASHSHLTARFAQAFGVTPSAVRARARS